MDLLAERAAFTKERPVRAFVAVDLDERVRRQIVRVQNALRPAIPGVKWVERELCHVTLYFLGYVPEPQLREIGQACQRAALESRPFELEFQGAGAFPNGRRPRVLWIGLGTGEAPLRELQSRLEQALQPLGFEPESRGFSPHLTIGRLKAPAAGSVEDLLRPFAQQRFGRVRVTEVRLMRSDLRPSGPTYSLLEAFPLAGLAI